MTSLEYGEDGFSKQNVPMNALAVSDEEMKEFFSKRDELNADGSISPDEKEIRLDLLQRELFEKSESRKNNKRLERPHKEARQILKFITTIENYCRYLQQDLLYTKVKTDDEKKLDIEVNSIFDKLYTSYEHNVYKDISVPIEDIVTELKNKLIYFLQY